MSSHNARNDRRNRDQEDPSRLPVVHVHIGDVHASDTPVIIKTVLGSCISACMYDPTTQIGGMNHFLLPGEVGDQDMSTRYGVNAMEVLINEMMRLGANRKRFQVKVFGGADIFQANHPMLMVGTKNIAFVHQFLEVEGIPIVNERVGGKVGVVVHYYAHTFDVMVKPMPTERFLETESEEARYRRRLTEDLRRGRQKDVTLF